MELLEHGDRRRRKCEEALEVKSLRRIISAYLKYVFFLSILFSNCSILLLFLLFNFFNFIEFIIN